MVRKRVQETDMPAIDDFGIRLLVQVPPPPPPAPVATPRPPSAPAQLRAKQAQLAIDHQADLAAAEAAAAANATAAALRAAAVAHAKAVLTRAEVDRLQAQVDLDAVRKLPRSSTQRTSAQQRLETARRVEGTDSAVLSKLQAATPAPAPLAAGTTRHDTAAPVVFTSALLQIGPSSGAPKPPLALQADAPSPSPFPFLAPPANSPGSPVSPPLPGWPLFPPKASPAPVPLPPQPLPVTVPAGRISGEMSYLVKPGDSLNSILAGIKKSTPQFDQTVADVLTTNPTLTTPPEDTLHPGQTITLYDARTRQGLAQVKGLVATAQSSAKANATYDRTVAAEHDPDKLATVAAQNADQKAQWTTITQKMTDLFNAAGVNSPLPGTFAPAVAGQLAALDPGDPKFQQAVLDARNTAQTGWTQQGRTQADLEPLYRMSAALAKPNPPGVQKAGQQALQKLVQDELDKVGDASPGAEGAIQARVAQLALWGPQSKGALQPAFAQALQAAREGALDRVAGKIAAGISSTYDKKGASAAAAQLADATDPAKHPEVSSEMAARVLVQLAPKVMPEIAADAGCGGQKGPGGGSPQDIIENISKAVGHAAMNSNPVTRTWESSTVQQGVQDTAKAFAQNLAVQGGAGPGWDDITKAITHAVADHADPTFALEFAKQIKDLKRQSNVAGIGPGDDNDFIGGPAPAHLAAGADYANSVLDAVTQGITKQASNVHDDTVSLINDSLFDEVGPDEYGQGLSKQQVADGVAAVDAANPDKVAKRDGDATKISQDGLNALRTQEAVVFYSDKLNGLSGFKGVQKAGDDFINSKDVANAIQASPDAISHMSDQALAQIFQDAQGKAPPGGRPLGLFNQSGDATEFAVEQGTEIDAMHQSAEISAQKQLADLGIKVGDRTAAGYPVFAAGLFLVSGLGAAANAKYLSTINFNPPTQKWAIEGLVGGFATYKLLHVAGILTRMSAVSSDKFKLPTPSDGPLLGKLTDWTISGRPELIYTLRGLFATASVWDGTNLATHIREHDYSKALTSGGNLAADVGLFLIQNGAIVSTRPETPSDTLTRILRMGRDVPAETKVPELGPGLVASLFKKLPKTIDIPYIGWAVNIIYGVDAVANFEIDNWRKNTANNGVVKQFLEGATGMDDGTAGVLADHDPGTGRATAPDLFAFWKSQGADPATLIPTLTQLAHDHPDQFRNFIARLPTQANNLKGQQVLDGEKTVGAPIPYLSSHEDGWLFEAQSGMDHAPVTYEELAQWAKENGVAVPDGNPATTLHGGRISGPVA